MILCRDFFDLISNSINAQKLVRHFSDPVRAERNRLKDFLNLLSEMQIQDNDYIDCLLLYNDLLGTFDRFLDKLDNIK